MSETENAGAPAADDREFADILRGLLGKVVTVVNPESYEHAPLGFTLKAGFYKAKVTGLGSDYLALITEQKKAGKESGKEPVKQFLPFARVKRLSLMKSECLIHI
jgi:hypothetical protein